MKKNDILPPIIKERIVNDVKVIKTLLKNDKDFADKTIEKLTQLNSINNIDKTIVDYDIINNHLNNKFNTLDMIDKEYNRYSELKKAIKDLELIINHESPFLQEKIIDYYITNPNIDSDKDNYDQYLMLFNKEICNEIYTQYQEDIDLSIIGADNT